MKKQPELMMTKKIITIDYQAKLVAAYEKMQERKIRHLPVTYERGAIIGILSDREIQRDMKPSKQGIELELSFDPKFSVKDFMRFPALQVRVESPLSEIVERMLKEKVSAYIVTNEHHSIGIVTTEDILKLVSQMLKEGKGSKPNYLLDHVLMTEGYLV
ncbi:MAG: CBS domain-containing protein [Xanthomonadaceae bacterium]|nr:CBS domain-containing protein [Xanthomonadaceae bacterium]